jgi:hypothetical protein
MVVGLVATAPPSSCISASPSIIVHHRSTTLVQHHCVVIFDPYCDRPRRLARRKQKGCLAVSPDPKRERFIFRKDVTKRTDPGGTSSGRPAMTFIRTAASASLALVLLVCIDDGDDDNDMMLLVVFRNSFIVLWKRERESDPAVWFGNVVSNAVTSSTTAAIEHYHPHDYPRGW